MRRRQSFERELGACKPILASGLGIDRASFAVGSG